MAGFIRTVTLVAATLAVLLVAAAMVAMVVAARAPEAAPAAGSTAPGAGEHDFRGARDLGSAAITPAQDLTPKSRLGGP
jgi:hypothetical protein